MNIPDLEAFVAVVETGSVVGASAKLHLTQPAVTRRIQNLERSLGEELLDRNSKPQKPTPSGRTAYTLARRMLACAEELRHAMRPGENASGEFRFGATHSLTDLALVEAVGRLRESYPKLTLHTSTDWSDALLKQVQAGSLDTAVVTMAEGFDASSGIVSERLGLLAGHVVVANHGPIGAKASLTEVSAQPWVLNQDGCSLRSFVRDALHAQRLPFDVAAEAAGAELQLALVARGLGLGVVTQPMLLRSKYRKAVHVVAVRDFKPRISICLVSRSLSGRLAGPNRCLKETLAASIATAGEKSSLFAPIRRKAHDQR